MTFTRAEELAAHRVYMNSIDTVELCIDVNGGPAHKAATRVATSTPPPSI